MTKEYLEKIYKLFSFLHILTTLYHSMVNTVLCAYLEKAMWTGYKYNWRKVETAAQDIAGWRQVVCDSMFHWERQVISHVKVKSNRFCYAVKGFGAF